MKTDDLISALAADGRRKANLDRSLLLALVAGAIVAGAAFFAALGFRDDIATAAQTVRFLFKFLVTLSLAAVAIAVVWRVGRPGVPLGLPSRLLIIPILLVAAAVTIELMVVPRASWGPRLVGNNWHHCLMAIPLLSIPTLAALLFAMRESAPSNPTFAGTVAGLAAAGIAATYYASNCADDSPLFVATWYSLAVSMVGAAGGLAGRRLLRW